MFSGHRRGARVSCVKALYHNGLVERGVTKKRAHTCANAPLSLVPQRCLRLTAPEVLKPTPPPQTPPNK